jgi:predicted kinase
MPILTVLVGLPGSGKSTYVKSIINENTFVYSTDQFIENAAKHFGVTYNEAFADNIKAAGASMNLLLNEAIQKRKHVIWDQTCLSAKKRRGIISRFPNSYARFCICRVPPRDDAEWAELNRRTLSREGKIIPSHIIESMADTYVEPTREEGFDVVRLYDIYGNAL